MAVTLMFYVNGDLNVLATCIQSLKAVCDCKIVIFTPDILPELDVEIITISEDRVNNRRMACKIECVWDYCRTLPVGTEVLVADVDLYFLRDPFAVFKIFPTMDIGVTTRFYSYWAAINGGVVYYRINKATWYFLKVFTEDTSQPVWLRFVEFRKKHRHERFGTDWFVDQDYLCVAWANKDLFDADIVDVGPLYNYCPARDVFGIDKAKAMVAEAYQAGTVQTLHLKDNIKELVYEGVFEHAVTKYPKGRMRWR